MDNSSKAEAIMDKARESVGNYCKEECGAYCCRKGYLVLDPEKVDLVTQGKKEEMLKEGTLKKLENGRFSMNMSIHDGCPSLKDMRCTIYKDRPKTCANFPIFLINDTVRLSLRCPAVRENLFYYYEKELIALGYKIAKEHPYSGLELHDVEF